MINKNKIILDLCSGTGSWSRPYKEAGYKVITITLPKYNVTWTEFGTDRVISFRKPNGVNDLVIRAENVYGILAAPPCTMFSFARTNAKKPRDLAEGMKCVEACLKIIWHCNEVQQATGKKTLPLKFWALENPYYGFLPQFLGKPAFTFDPSEKFGLFDGQTRRSITPQGFAKAFFDSNG